ncbi:glycosyltransferase family protein [Olivibacter ginsenosidimutans]|uniref:Glycosyltransferase family protein n=1 Tax=Olivibacter ginsenosidimutans TaxID=1176537 RepID=A0ABP9AKT9_9SPHI
MVSVIIVSINPDFLRKVKENIGDTIGISHEIIAIDNTHSNYGICQLYNAAAQQAKFEIVCFMHEDIVIHTESWGKKIVDLFGNHPNLGLIGVAGSAYKTFSVSGWDILGDDKNVRFINYIQGYKFLDKESDHQHANSTKKNLTEVAAVDGMWMCTKRSIVLSYPFDEETLSGFHGYDIDFCLSLYKKYVIAVTFDILIEHYSEGNFDKNWFREIIKVHEKWRSILPINLAQIRKREMEIFEKRAFKRGLPYYIELNYTLKSILKILNRLKLLKLIGRLTYLKLYYATIKSFLFSKQR